MNLRAKCINQKCKAFGVEKSVLIGQLSGFGAPNERVLCALCGELMQTTKSINASEKARGKGLRIPTREPSRTKVGKRKAATRKPSRNRKRI